MPGDRRMRHGARPAWAAGAPPQSIRQSEGGYAGTASANSSSSSSSIGANVLSGLVESVIGLRLP